MIIKPYPILDFSPGAIELMLSKECIFHTEKISYSELLKRYPDKKDKE